MLPVQATRYKTFFVRFSRTHTGTVDVCDTVVTTVVIVDALQRTGNEYRRKTVRTRKLLWARALLRMDDHRLPTWIMSGEPENAGRREPRWAGVEEQ